MTPEFPWLEVAKLLRLERSPSGLRLLFTILSVVLVAGSPAQAELDPDLNGDSAVDILDVSLVTSCISQILGEGSPCDAADADQDGDVDQDDLSLVILHFGERCGDGTLNLAEQCDGTDDAVCPGQCLPECSCEVICVPETTEECYDGPPETQGVAACTSGIRICLGDGTAYGPCEGQTLPGTEACNGADDDCNGIADDLGTTACGLGSCSHTIDNCIEGQLQVCDPFAGATSEICDGEDNDCNGPIDDGIDDVVSGSEAGECVPEIQSCVGGSFIVVQAGVDPQPEVCNDNLDQDCDGEDCTIVEITIESPSPNTLTTDSQIDVTGTVSELAISATVDETPATITNGLFSAIGVPLHEGANSVTATAIGSDGSAATSTVSIVRDTEAPVVTIVSPNEGLETSEDSITVTGMVNDIVVGTVNATEATVTVNGVQADVANRSYVAVGVPIPDDQVTVVATDGAGNVSLPVTVTITRPPPGPEIRAVSGGNQTAPIETLLQSPLVAELLDPVGAPVEDGLVVFRVVENDGLVSDGERTASSVAVSTDSTGRASVEWTLGSRAGAGNNRVEATSVGASGTATFSASAEAQSASLIVLDSGNQQTGSVGKPLPRPLVAIVVDSGNNRIPDVPVTFAVQAGAGHFNGSDMLTVATDSNGRALAVLTLGLAEGIDNNTVVADFPGNAGLPAAFRASGVQPADPAQTSVTGLVLDNSDQPIEGVTLRILGTATESQSGANGQFTLAPAQVGTIFIEVDGSTANRPGVWPTLEYEVVTISGIANDLPRPVYLVEIDVGDCPSPTSVAPGETSRGTCVWVSEDNGAVLESEEIPGLSVTVAMGTTTFADSSRSGHLSVTAVHADKIPMTPGFGQQPRLIVTIQPPGAEFDPPAPLTLPNVEGLAPGAVTELYSFDHDLRQFVAIGTGSVSNDGTLIESDPGIGILKAGWHSGGPPSPSGCTHQCPVCSPADANCTCVAVSGDSVAGLNMCEQCINGLHVVPDMASCCQATVVTNSWASADGVATCCGGNPSHCINPALQNPTSVAEAIYLKCLIVHETEHHNNVDCAAESVSQGATPCATILPGFSSPQEQADGPGSECFAARLEVQCLQGEIGYCGSDTTCVATVLADIADAKNYGNSFNANRPTPCFP